jgi:hypothetical protein
MIDYLYVLCMGDGVKRRPRRITHIRLAGIREKSYVRNVETTSYFSTDVKLYNYTTGNFYRQMTVAPKECCGKGQNYIYFFLNANSHAFVVAE